MTMPKSGDLKLSDVADRIFGQAGYITLSENRVRDYLGVQTGDISLASTRSRAFGGGRIDAGRNPSIMQRQTDVDTSINGTSGNVINASIGYNPNPSWSGKVYATNIWNQKGAQYLCGYFYCHPDVSSITVSVDCARNYDHRPSTGGELKLQVRGFQSGYLSGGMSELYNDRIMNYNTGAQNITRTMSVPAGHPHIQIAFQITNNAGMGIPNTETGIGFQMSNIKVTC